MEATLSLIRILAMVMYGEAGILHDDSAAMAVGHVFLNRLEDGGFGSTPEEICKGFHAFHFVLYEDVPEKYIKLAELTIFESTEGRDITHSSLYIISHSDTQTIAGLVGYPRHAALLRMAARWKSAARITNGTIYALYAYREFPVTVLRDLVTYIPKDNVPMP